jgi:hypothetical protein
VARARFTASACLATIALLAGCGGEESEREGAPSTLAVTLTDDACRYAGPESVPAGDVSIDVENASSSGAVFELVRLDEGATAEALADYVAEQQRRIESGERPGKRPSSIAVVDRIPVMIRWSSALSADTSPGTYGVLCTIGPPPTAVYLATTIEARA